MGTEMIPFEQALETALGVARKLPSETIDLPKALSRVLAEDVNADMDMPPFDKSIVDGYACQRADLAKGLALVETIAAGYEPKRSLEPGECAKIMTGAMIPVGADCVFMVEDSEEEGAVVKFTGEQPDNFIMPRAKDVKCGDVLLRTGHRLFPADIAVLASMGYDTVSVSRVPKVGVVATGDELVEPGVKPSISQIRNSNGYQLCAQVEAIGAEANYCGIAGDSEDALNAIVGPALESHDVVLLSGGVSMGEFDFVPGILKAHGVKLLFEKVAIQPGKPTVFGLSDSVFCFGLPGNPVSTFTTFELIVKPFLFRMMGHAYDPPSVHMPLAEPFVRKAGTRQAWVPITLGPEGITKVDYHGSAHMNALTHADGMFPFPVGVTEFDKGAIVPVRLLRN
jgi:molybdopterin molybdotransferase